MTNKFNIFVASSLALRDERKAILELAQELNLNADQNKALFSVFEYEESEDILQTYNSQDAQAPIEEILQQSAFFIIICNGVVGNKTVDEFLHARARYEAKQYPAYIYVLARDYRGCEESCPQPGINQISYAQFESNYNLLHRLDGNGEADEYKKIYSIPYTNGEDIKVHMRKELGKVLRNEHFRPLIDAKRGCDITAEDFYLDPERKHNCQPGLYFKRKFDKTLVEALENQQQKFIYIHGTSLSGKTRAVVNAAQNCPNTWFYIFRQDSNPAMIEEMERIASYVQHFKINNSLCIVFDDFDQTRLALKSEDGRFENAFGQLMRAVMGHEASSDRGGCSVIFTASTPASDVLWESVSRNEIALISIPPLSNQEMQEACRYFQIHGKTIGEKNRAYHTTGALLIDIDSIKGSYASFIKEFPSGRSILYAIKALSMWRRKNLGKVDYIRSFAQYYHEEEYGTRLKNFEGALQHLCDKCKGIARSTDSTDQPPLIIEEYVYRYILPDVLGLTALNAKEMVGTIMEYSSSSQLEPLIVTAGKLMIRCDSPSSLPAYLFDICTCPEPQKGWKQQLRQQVEQIEQTSEAQEAEQKAYSRIFRHRIYASTSFDEALEIFHKAAWCDEMMLSALIEEADTQEDISRVEKLSQFCNAKDSLWVKMRRSMKEDNFADAYRWLQDCKMPDIEDETDFHQKEGLMGFYLKAIQQMLCLVTSQSELDLLLDLLRQNYHTLLANVSYSYLSAHVNTDPSNLTLFDLLPSFNTYSIHAAFSQLVSQSGVSEHEYIEECLIPILKEALRRNHTPRKIVRQLGGMIVNAIFDQIPKEVSYETVFNDVFRSLSFDYTDRDGHTHTMKLWNDYLYSRMMLREDCDYWKASELIQNYLLPQSRDEDNFLMVTRFILNSYVSLTLKENSTTLQKKVFDLFALHGVQPDVYTFNMMMKQAQSLDESLAYLRQMLRSNVSPDSYTFVSLLEPVKDAFTLIAYLGLPRSVTQGMQLPNILEGDEELTQALKTKFGIEDIRKYVSCQEYAWDMLFMKFCQNENEVQAKRTILKYLEDTPEMHVFLQRSTIYSCCLKDRKMTPSAVEAHALLTSIKQRGITSPDAYIYCQVLATYKRARVNMSELNALYRDIYADIGPNLYCCNARLDFFKGYTDQQPCLMPGDPEPVLLTPIGYIRALIDRGLSINEETIVRFYNIYQQSKEAADADTYAQLIDLCRSQGIRLSLEATYHLLEAYRKARTSSVPEAADEHLQYLHDLLTRFPSYQRNKQVAVQFARGKSTDFVQAAEQIIADNIASATIAYNSILHNYQQRCRPFLKRQKTDRRMDGLTKTAFFDSQIRPYYERFFTHGITPTAETIAIMASSAADMQQAQYVLSLAKAHQLPRVTEHCFTNVIQAASSYADIKKLCELYADVHGITSLRLLSPLVNVIELRARVDVDCRRLMTCIARYLFPDTDDQAILAENAAVLQRYEGEIRPLQYLESPANIDIYIVRSVLRFRQSNIDYKGNGESSNWKGRFEVVLQQVFDRYLHVCAQSVSGKAGFLESIIEDTRIAVYENTYIKLFWQIAQANPDTTISFEFAKRLAANIRHNTDYNRLREALQLTHPGWVVLLFPSQADEGHSVIPELP